MKLKTKIGKTNLRSITADILESIFSGDEKQLKKDLTEMRLHLDGIEKRINGELPPFEF